MNSNLSLTSFIRSITTMSEEQAIEIANQFTEVSFQKGQKVLEIGQVSKEYYFIESGLLRAFLYDIEGNEVTNDFFIEQNVAFEVTSFFNQSPSQINIEAVIDTVGLKIEFAKLNELFHNIPAFREFGRAVLVREFMASKQRNYNMITKTAEQRYHQLVVNKPQIIQYAPLKHVASYLGITDSTLSRIRAKN